MQRARGLASAGLVAGVLAGPATGQAAADLQAGAAVEVREGDVWSAAELVKREGRRFQIRYADGTEEWVTQDRLRTGTTPAGATDDPGNVLKPGRAAAEDNGAAGVLKPGRAAAADDAPAAGGEQAPNQRRFRTGQKVEYKSGSFWRAGEIKQASGELYLVGDEKSTSNFMSQWMIAETIREPGESFEGAPFPDQFSHRVGHDDLRESLAGARKELEDFRLEQSQKVTNDATGRADPFGPLPFDQPVTEADRSQMNLVVSRAAGGDAVTPDAAGGGDHPADRRRGQSRHRRILREGANLAVSGSFGLVGLVDSPPGGAVRTAAERLDLTTGRSTGSAAFDPASGPEDISFDGQRVAAIATAKSPTRRHRVDVWDWSGPEPSHVVSFKPSATASSRGADAYVTAARFLANGNLAVVESNGTISAWNVAAGSATGVWSISLDRNATVTRSPGGRQLAVSSGSEVLLLDAETGEPLAVQSSLGFAPSHHAFSPSGRYLALASRNQFAMWDLGQGVLGPRIALPPGADGLIATDDGNTVTRNRLIDGETGATVWAYTPPEGMRETYTAPGILLGLTAAQDGPRTLAAWPLPHPKAANATPPAARNVFATGSTVALNLSAMEGDTADKQQIEQNLIKQLEGMGVQIAPDAPIKIVGKTATESEQQQFQEQRSPPFAATESATVTTKTTTLTVESDGIPLWQTASRSGSSGYGIQLQEGESLQQNLDRQAAVNLGPFGNVALPQIVPAPADPQGTTTLRPGGYAD